MDPWSYEEQTWGLIVALRFSQTPDPRVCGLGPLVQWRARHTGLADPQHWTSCKLRGFTLYTVVCDSAHKSALHLVERWT